MLPISTNILDQLLGGFESQPSGPTGASGVSGEQGQPFGELLGQMLGSTISADKILPQNLQSLFPPNDRPVAQDGAPAGPTVDVSQLMGAPASVDIMSPILLGDAEIFAQTPNTLSTEPGLADGRLPFADLPVNRFDPSLLASYNNEKLLNSAEYDVLDAQIEGERLELTLATQDKAEGQIRLSVPLSVFEKTVLGQAGQGSKLDIGAVLQPVGGSPFGDQMLSMDQLLKALNLKTLEVQEPALATSSPVAQAPLELTLIGENQGARIALTAKINKQDLFVKTSNDPTGNLALSSSNSGLMAEDSASGKMFSEDNSDEYQMLFKKPLSDSARNLTKNVLSDVKPFSLDALTSADGSEKLAPRAGSTQNTVTPTPVKLTLPETITRPFLSTAQTIMIKIEPEHLGPARLNLAVYDQMLTARVTVNTATARMAVEGSLTQLTEQLSRAGILVDRIDVVLSDGGTPHHFHDQRPLWSRARRQRQIKDENEMTSDILSIPITMLPPRQYVGTQGVNLLA